MQNNYDIFDVQVGLDGFLQKTQGILIVPQNSIVNPITEGLSASDLQDGSQNALLSVVKKNFEDTSAGKIEGIDPNTGTYKWLIGDASNSVDWNVTEANTLTIKGSLVAGEIHIPDRDTTTNSFHTDSDGNSWGGA